MTVDSPVGEGMHLRVGAGSFVMCIEAIDLETQEAVKQTLGWLTLGMKIYLLYHDWHSSK